MPRFDKRGEFFAFPCESHKKSCLDKWMDARLRYTMYIVYSWRIQCSYCYLFYKHHTYTSTSQVYTIFSYPAQTRTTEQRMLVHIPRRMCKYPNILRACWVRLRSHIFQLDVLLLVDRNLKVSIQFLSISNIFESTLCSEIQATANSYSFGWHICVSVVWGMEKLKSLNKNMDYVHPHSKS